MIFKIRKKSMDHFYPNKYDVPLPMTQQSPKYLFCIRMRGGGKLIKRGRGGERFKGFYNNLETTRRYSIRSVLCTQQIQTISNVHLYFIKKLYKNQFRNYSMQQAQYTFTVEKKCKILKIFAGEIIQMYLSLLLLKWKTVSANQNWNFSFQF